MFDAVSVYYGGEIGVQLRDRAEFTGIWWVNPEFFRIVGQKPGAGAVVSEAFAARHFGDPSRAVGQPVQIENRVYEIGGVLSGPRFPAEAEIWLPAPSVPENPESTAFNYCRAVARIAPDVSLPKSRLRSTP